MHAIKDEIESALVSRLKAGDYKAFEALYSQYSARFLYQLEFLTKDGDDAADLLQELFVKVWERRSALDTERSFSAFLRVVLRNMVIDYFRTRARIRNLNAHSVLGEAEEDLTNNPQEIVYFKEAENLLLAAINRLPKQQQVVFQLCKIEGKSYKETAALMNISAKTVHQHLYQAVRSIKTYLIQSGGFTTSGLLILYFLGLQ